MTWIDIFIIAGLLGLLVCLWAAARHHDREDYWRENGKGYKG